MKIPALLLLMLAAVSGAFAQAEPTPVATPSDVPTATVSPAQPSPTAEPAKAAATPCPECGMTADQCKDEKPAAKPAEDVDGTLRGLEQEYAEAIKANDVAFVQRVVSEDCTNVGPDGGIAYKADLLTVLRSGLLKVESFTYNDMKVRVYGETAVVTGECVVKARLALADASGHYRWMDVFVKHGDQWQVVASQATPIGKPTEED